MFLQIIEARAKDAQRLEERWTEWRERVKPGAIGYQGSVAGMTESGDFIAAIRFESEATAAQNSSRPEQSDWWAQTAALLSQVRFRDCPEAELWIDRGHSAAKFVQAIQGPPDREDHTDEEVEELEGIRPDILGGLSGTHEDGGFTTFVFFTDEESAREGESAPEFEEWHDEGFVPQERRFWDLRDPWIDVV